MYIKFKLIYCFICILGAILFVGLYGCDGNSNNGSGCGDTDTDESISSEEAHGKTLHYEAVFSDSVKRIDIIIEPDKWQAMLDDMTAKFGEFGELPDFFNQIPSGGFDPDNFPPPGGGEGGFPFPGGGEGGFPFPGGGEGGFPFPGDGEGGFPFPGDGEGGFPFPGDGEGGFTPPSGGFPGGFSDENPIWADCTVKYNGLDWNRVGIRFKGQSTLMSSWIMGVGKLPFRLDFDQFEDEYPETKNQRFYGFKKIALSNNWTDNSMIREKVAGDIFREAGVPMARSTFCRVYIDHGEGPQYFGLYSMIEIPDDPILKTQFEDDDGNLYKPRGNFFMSGTLPGSTFAEGTFGEEFFEKETNKKKEDWSDIEAVFVALHADARIEDPGKWREDLEAVFNVDGFLKYLAVNTVIQNWDTYGLMPQNYYLYGEPQEGDKYLVHWIAWDNNMALTDDNGIRPPLSLELSADEVSEDWPLIRFLMDDPVYRATYVSYVEETVNGVFDAAKTKERFQKARELVEPYVVGEEGEQPGYTFLTEPGMFEAAYETLFEFVDMRHQAAEAFLLRNKP